MGPELVGDNLSSSSGGWWWGWSELNLKCVHRQITFVVHHYIGSLVFKPSEPTNTEDNKKYCENNHSIANLL